MNLEAFFDPEDRPTEKAKPIVPPVENVQQAIQSEDGRLVSMYLVCGYAYEFMDSPLIPDDLFDKLCLKLDKVWDKIDHPHKTIIDRDTLKTSTFSYLSEEQIPSIVKSVAHRHVFNGWDK